MRCLTQIEFIPLNHYHQIKLLDLKSLTSELGLRHARQLCGRHSLLIKSDNNEHRYGQDWVVAEAESEFVYRKVYSGASLCSLTLFKSTQ